jgi:hypothetical protein
MDWLTSWLKEDILKAVLPRAVGALVALAAAHSDILHKWGVTVDWNTFAGKATTAGVLLIGLLAHHHIDKAVGGAK